MKLIIGLGNPGEKYLGTRHNLGFAVIDELAHQLGVRVQGLGFSWKNEKKFKSEIFDYTLDPSRYTLVKPQTFMNQSGLAVSLIANFYNITPEDIIVVHDELDLLLGKIKVRQGGAAGGHHGVESIIKELGSDQFVRVRLGIGNQKSHLGEHHRISFNAEHYVLDPFLPAESSKVKHMLKQALEAIDLLLKKGLPEAQNQFN